MTLYTQPTCNQCKMVHILMDKKHLQYNECQDLEVMKVKGIDHTPTLELEDGRLLKGQDLFKYINEAK